VYATMRVQINKLWDFERQ